MEYTCNKGGFKMKKIYLDYAATTPIKDEVLKEMLPYLTEHFENPSSIYTEGMKNKAAIEDSRSTIARCLNCDYKEIFFTSSATESNNWAIKGIAFANRHKGNHIITSRIEHPSVLESCFYLQKHGFEITYLPTDEYGIISLDDLKNAITDKTILISIMFANNEIGTIQPIKGIGEIAREKNIFFHTDAVQAIGNIDIDLNEYNIDLLSFSGHKIYGSKGIGCLFIRNWVNIDAFMHGGGQERLMRSGTENTANCVGLGRAVELSTSNIKNKSLYLAQLRDELIDQIYLNIGCAKLNGHPNKRLANNVNFSFGDVNGKRLVRMLDEAGIKASSGSACSCGAIRPSHVLLSLGLSEKLAIECIRFTLGEETTREDIDYLLKHLITIIKEIRTDTV